MAYTISKYRPRYPGTSNNFTHNGIKLYRVTQAWQYNYDFWVCPYTLGSIRESEPFIMGMKVSVETGSHFSLTYSTSSGYRNQTSNTEFTDLFTLYPATYGIEQGQEFNLEIVITESQILVYINGVVAYTRSNNLAASYYLRWISRDASNSATDIRMRSSYETRVLEERLGNWQFHEMEPVLPPDQPLTASQLSGFAAMQESTSVNFRLNPAPLSPQGQVVAMEIETEYRHKRTSPRGGQATLRYEGIGEVIDSNLGLSGANVTGYSILRRTQQAENITAADMGSIMHQLRYTLTPDEFLG